VPPDRWQLRAFYDPDVETWGMTTQRFGGFIDGIDQFDPEFFGISPREAPCIDPQQRLMLELAWEAIEDGGEVVDLVRGSATGVFVGCCTQDYLTLQGTLRDRALLDLHVTMGSALSINANRISFCLNLLGPSVALDTACSSSLTAIHLACRSLRERECTLALAGGVNAIITPRNYISLKAASMLSPDGRCKAFDSRANGFVRSEGGGMVLLKPLCTALADGNPIYAVIRGSASNQDGRTVGITVPSREAQEALVKQACRAAGVSPNEVYYVEAHGTGTPVGDPIEAHALSAALCQDRTNSDNLVVGSVKTNIGHLEAGAGVAGMIKLALMLEQRKVPPNLHLVEANPRIDFQKLKLRVPPSLESLPEGHVIVGINSFGFGGANSHAVVESPPPNGGASYFATPVAETQLLVLSARGDEVLPNMARRYAAFLKENCERGQHWLCDVCYTASLRRTHHEHRLAVIGGSAEELAGKLEAFANKETRAGLFSGQVLQDRKLVFVFSGQGPQWWAMGRQLLAREPVFRSKIEDCDHLFRQWGRWSLIEHLAADEQNSRLHETSIAQPAIFSLQVALAALWSSWGIEPDAVVGHSVGEVAAAHVSGALDFETAARVIFHRGRCMGLAPTTGRMLAAALSAEEAIGLLNGNGGHISLAAINSPASVTLSGEPEPLGIIEKSLTERGVFSRFLKVQYAFHSAHMQPVEHELLAALTDLHSQPPKIPLFSTVTGASLNAGSLDALYWWRNVRETVHFAGSIDGLLQEGANTFLEISPHPVLAGAVMECAARRSLRPLTLSSLRRGEDETLTMLEAVSGLHSAGYRINWRALFPVGGRCVRLPTYAWNHRRYWQETEESRQERLAPFVHPLLGRKISSANPYWENRIEGGPRSLISEHRVQGNVVFPAAAYVEMALAAATQLLDGPSCTLEDVEIHKPLFLPDGGEGPSLQFTYNSPQKGFQIFSRANESQASWNLNCSGKLASLAAGNAPTQAPTDILARCRGEIPAGEIYQRFADIGYNYGPYFQGIQRIWRGEGEALGRIAPPARPDDEKYQIPPGLLDSCLQVVLAAALPRDSESSIALYLPARMAQVRLHRKPERELWCHARVSKLHRGMLEVNFCLFNDAGETAVEVDGFVCLAVEGARRFTGENLEDSLYEFQWQLQPLACTAPEPPDYFPEFQVLAHRLQEAANASATCSGTEKFSQLETEIDRLCACYVARAFDELGFLMRAGNAISESQLRARVAPEHHAVLARYLGMLETDGVLEKTELGWVVRRPLQEDPDRLWRAVYARLPSYLPEAALLRRSGGRLPEILQGKADPLEVLFGGNSFIEQFFSDSVSYRPSYRTVRGAIEAVVEKLPEGRKLRILELGAGTGGLTSCVLPALSLPPEQVEYVFTDLTSHFLARAERRFHRFGCMRYQILDLEKSPAEQGFGAHAFDLVLAANVLHATSDVRRSLSHIKQLLAPNGMLLVLEIDHPSRWVDLIFGLTKGWWLFADKDLRPSYPLLSGARWVQVLEEEGFNDCAAVSDVGGLRDTRHVMLLARGPDIPVQTLPVPAGEIGRWLVFTDRDGLAQKLASELVDRGHACIMASAGECYQETAEGHFQIRPAEKEDMKHLLDAVGKHSAQLDAIVFCWGIEPPGAGEPSTSMLETAQVEGCHTMLALVQALAEANQFPQLWVITRGTQPAGRERRVTVRQSALWGLGRVLMNENPRLRCRMVDLPLGGGERESSALCTELCAGSNEEEIALRGYARYVLRAVRLPTGAGTARPAAGTPFRAEITKPGVLDELTLRPFQRRAPGPGEVEVQVRMAAMNFRDVMKALGIYPRESPDHLILGDECGGHIVSVGEGVTDFHIGDRVLVALASHCLASHVTCPAFQVAHLPPGLDWEQGVTVPIAFMTSAYALYHLAKIASGERVLIHSAAGGVGLAAVQMALAAGCEVFATAGNDEKRDFLRALGAHHVMDSRTLSFTDEIMHITDGEGIDVVLNSLAGEALAKSISLLRHNGRFIEIGKRDIFGNSTLALRPFRTNICFHSLDLIVATQHQPHVMRALWERILREIDQGKLHTMPTRMFPMNEVAEAFRYMMKGDHIGKIVLSVAGNETIVEPLPESHKLRFQDNATYLITGGLGGFGLAAARWMADRGARHLVLAGRSGASSEAARAAVEELKKDSIRVIVAKTDVSKAGEIAELLGEMRRSMPPLHGIIHAAMVLDDGVALQLDARRFQKVMAPKVGGAWHLHLQTRDDPLDFFVCFSSVTSVIGNSGQANYAAANAVLDGLAHYRRAQRLPALTVNWGPIKDVGYVAQHPGLSDSLAYLGMKVLEVRPALDMMGRLLPTQRAQVGVIEANWNQWAKSLGSLSPPARFCNLITQSGNDSDQIAEGKALREAISAAGSSERRQLMEAFLRKHAAKVLRTSTANLDASKPLHELGLDSLTAVELVNLIEGDLGLAVPTAKLMGGENLLSLAAMLAESIEGPSAAPVKHEQKVEPGKPVEELSDAEVEALLHQHANKAGEILDRAETSAP
jgi:acyl transferase domain-containing protein/acyl carrier protein